MPVGIATALAVLLHEIPQEIGDFGVLIHGWYSKAKALKLNFLSALTAFFGVVIALIHNWKDNQLESLPFTYYSNPSAFICTDELGRRYGS
jgi:zinc transporter ZupT